MYTMTTPGTTGPIGRAGREPGTADQRAAIGRLAIRAVLALAVLVSAAGAVAVVAVPQAAAHGIDANGCTGVPDSGYGFAFHGSCDRHDRCYGAKPYGSTSAGRRQCDRVFRSDMLDYCSRHRFLSAKGIACRTVARTYYLGVRVLGHPYWVDTVPTPIA